MHLTRVCTCPLRRSAYPVLTAGRRVEGVREGGGRGRTPHHQLHVRLQLHPHAIIPSSSRASIDRPILLFLTYVHTRILSLSLSFSIVSYFSLSFRRGISRYYSLLLFSFPLVQLLSFNGAVPTHFSPVYLRARS